MTIVCGTDFTEPAARAVRVASALALRLGQPLHLVHVVDEARRSPEELARIREQLDLEAERASNRGLKVTVQVATGPADEALVEIAAEQAAHMLVVAALGRRSPNLWTLGSTADRVAQTSSVPVLVVRNSEPLEQWLDRSRELRAVIGVDSTPTSDAALRWLDDFATLHAARLVAAHVYWPPQEYERLRKTLGREAEAVTGPQPEIERELARELAPRLAQLAPRHHGQGLVELRFVGGLGRPDDHLVQFAEGEHADLVAVGSRQRTGISRFWHGSVSHGVIELAPCSVLCVPSGE